MPLFPDKFKEEEAREFPEDVPVFHLSGEEPSAYEDVIKYLMEKVYPLGLSREKKMVFQTKITPFTLIKGPSSGWARMTNSDDVWRSRNKGRW